MWKWIEKYKSLSIQVRASFWFLICSVLQKGISIITTPIFTRLLTSQEYGKFNVFLSWQGIITAIVILTLPWGVVEQGLIKYSGKRYEFTSAPLGLMTSLSAGWLILYLLFNDFWNGILSLSTVQMIGLFSIMWSSSVFTFWSINQRIDYKYKRLVLLTLGVSVLKPLLGIYLVTRFDDKVTARILGLAGVEMAAFLALFVKMMTKGKVFYSRAIWKYALEFNIPLIPHYLAQRILNSSDRIMIERMCNAGDAGIYSLAYSLAMIMVIVNQAIQSALNPWIYKKIKEDKASELNIVVYPALLIVASVNLLLISLAPEAVRIFAPREYYNAIWVVPPVAMSVFFMFMYGFFANFEFYYEKTKLMSFATCLGAVLNVFLNYIFLKKFGYYAAGYTTLLCYILYTLCHFLIMRNICQQNNMNSKIIFNPVTLLGISGGFMCLGFLISLTYRSFICRYFIIAFLLILGIMNRRRIIAILRVGKHDKYAF